jgi:hypothetical protein
MINRPSTHRWIAWQALGGALALSSLSVLFLAANSWGQPQSPAQGAPATQGATPGAGSARGDVGAVQAQGRDRLDVLDAQLEAKRTLVRIDESRAEHAKRWQAYYEKMVREGKVIEDRMLAARDDVLMMDAHVEAEKAELKVAEMRAKYARQHVAQGAPATGGADQAREELDVLETLLEAKRTLLRAAESRAEQAKRRETHYEKLFRGKLATEDLVLAAKDDVLMMDSVLAWGRADLKVAEARVKTARRIASQGGSAADGVGPRIAELEERLAAAEMKADVLQHEVGRLRRELPRETHGAR